MPDIGKIYHILEVIQQNSQQGISNKELSETLNLPPSTCSRILSALSTYDFVYKRAKDSHYFLGFAHLRFAQTLLATNNEVSIYHPFLDRLHDELGETVFYAKYNGRFCVVIDVRGAVNTRIAVGLGEIMPLHCSAAGKAVLAFIPDFERKKLYENLEFDRYTDHTTVDLDSLENEIAEIQHSHISYNYAEFHDGINAVAAPVFNSSGTVVGALAIVGTAVRLSDKQMTEAGHTLNTYSKRLSTKLITREMT